ncbi:MAG: hypothetical protein AAF386_02210 [Pseudomonadota bacterium]
MPSPNTQFELSVEDLDLIETALRDKKTEASLKSAGECDETRDLHELLGRLHNQKEFYRPKTGAYVGG